jgi:hypothetical protein
MVKYCITIFRTMNRQVLNRGMTILAGTVLVTTLMMMAPSVYAASPDFTIETFGIVDGNPSMTVKGTAGGTTPDETGDIHAYVLVTNEGIYAVTSHPGIEDSDEVKDDAEWHAHKVELNNKNCVTDLQETGNAVLDGHTVAVKDTDPEATSVESVLTATLSAEKKGDEPDTTAVCVAHVFDSQEEP